MGFFGGKHSDDRDSALSLSQMTVLTDIPEAHEPGRFHLPGLGMYVTLETYRGIYFSGRMKHGGTPPLAPAGQEPPAWAARCVVICYPSGAYVNGVTRQAIGSLSCLNDLPLYLTPEMVGIK